MRGIYRASIAVIVFLTVVAFVWPNAQGVISHNAETQTTADIYSDYAPVGLTSVARNSRASAVYISVVKNNGNQGMGSGTYGIYKGYPVIITAAHVVSDCSTIIVSSYNGEMEAGRVAYLDEEADLAVLYVEPMRSMPQQRFKFIGPKRDMIGKDVVYSGNPNRVGLLTIYGNVAGYSYNRMILHSYAWMGASGSGVYDKHGNLVGVVSAISIGRWIMPQLIEDVVYVAPIYYMNETVLQAALEVIRDDL